MGTRESVFITYASGGIVIGLAMIAARGGNLKAIQQVPYFNMMQRSWSVYAGLARLY